MIELTILIMPLFPLAAFLINGLFGRWIKEIGGWIAVFAMGTAATLSLILLIAAWAGMSEVELPLQTRPLWEWIATDALSISIGFHFDALTAIMCFIINFVGALVFLYSIGYMQGDPGFSRFFTYLSLFVFSMLLLVLADSFPLLFIGWEGVGLCSYLLIGYYMDKPGAPSAGKKAFIVNRVGDFGFLIAMFLIYKATGTLKISEVLALAPDAFEYAGPAITAVTLLLLLGCSGKSAQIPLFIWLPDAMAGPTPVSALIHAATMVTAGVYLVARTSLLFAMAPASMATMAVVGGVTAFVAATIAITQRDIKRVLAYSTISQLGYMFLACGVGAFSAGVFHVFTHSFFKACLFLGAGALIHGVGGTQDLFLLGGLRKRLRVVWITFFVASLAIAGFPLTAGFFSKDEILWRVFSASPDALRIGPLPVLYVLGIVTALLTAVYSFRALFLAFHGRSRLPPEARERIHAPHWTMSTALIALAIGALTTGFLNVPHALAPITGGLIPEASFERFLGDVTRPAERIIAAHAADIHDEAATDEESAARAAEASHDVAEVPREVSEAGHGSFAAEIALTLLSSIVALVGIGLAFRFFLRRWPDGADAFAERHPFLNQLSREGWWWDQATRTLFAGGAALLGRLAVWIDQRIIDGFLHTISRVAREGSRAVRRVQMGQVQVYALMMLIGANILLLVILIWR